MTATSTHSAARRVPSVLVVLVAKDAADWLRDCLSALAAQTYARLGVIAVDNASSDGTNELLTQALGEARVIRLDEDGGVPRSIEAAVRVPAVRAADYLLILHDDTALDPDAVARLVDAATGIGVEEVGVVGPKVVDWDDPRLLLDVGRSADLFGHPYTPLQTGEIDQGQFDRVLEVLCVSSCAMLVARDTWTRTGLFDDRLDAKHEELDFCWRARLAGAKVLMTPLARARHRDKATADVSPGRRRSHRYYEDRAALATMLKNYKLFSLLWLLPLDAALGVLRILYLLLSRRFEEAFDLVAAWGWNVAHLPGTISKRVRVQSVRRVRDRQLRRFMESAGLRLPRWFETASRILEEQREIDQEDEGASVGRRLRVRTASLVSAHPVVVASFLAVVVGAVALRGFFGPEPLAGGVLPAFPSSVRGFFGELLSGFRTTPLGGSLAASPALGAMGALSWLTFGSTAIAQKALVVGGVVLAAVLTYRAVARLTGRPGPAVAASVSLALSALVLWSLSEGRFALSIAVAVVAATAERLEAAFSAEPPPDRRWRFVVGLGVTVAVGTAFVPGVVLGVAVLVGAQVVLGHARVRGLIIVALAAVVAGALLFPFLPTIAAGGGAALGSTIGTTDLDHLGRLALGPGPGTWIVSLFLPVAALLGYALVGVGYRARALRAVAAAGAGLALAWLSAAGRLPGPLSNAPVYASVAAVGEALLIGYGLASALSGMGRESFGLRQVGTGLLALVLGGGIFLQAVGAMLGGWAVGGPDAVPPALAVVASAKGDFRVLWIGRDDGSPFVAPGGDPVSVAQAGPSSLRYGLTGRNGTTALDVGRTLTGGGAGYLADALNEILSGATSHGGALLAPLGVRFVVADAGDVPPTAARSLDRQLDMDLIPAGGLRIYRNAAAVPPAAVVSASLEDELASSDLATIARLPSAKASPLHSVPGGWAGDATAGSRAVVSTEFDPDWTLLGGGSSSPPREAWGWATSFDTGSGSIRIRYTGQWIRTVEMSVLAVLWLAALWITRRPVAR